MKPSVLKNAEIGLNWDWLLSFSRLILGQVSILPVLGTASSANSALIPLIRCYLTGSCNWVLELSVRSLQTSPPWCPRSPRGWERPSGQKSLGITSQQHEHWATCQQQLISDAKMSNLFACTTFEWSVSRRPHLIQLSLYRGEDPFQHSRLARFNRSLRVEATQQRMVEVVGLQLWQNRCIHLVMDWHRASIVQFIHLRGKPRLLCRATSQRNPNWHVRLHGYMAACYVKWCEGRYLSWWCRVCNWYRGEDVSLGGKVKVGWVLLHRHRLQVELNTHAQHTLQSANLPSQELTTHHWG